MNLVFIYGAPGVGKLTVAKELAKLTGYRLFHNHLTVDLAYSLFDFGTQPFIDLRERIWMMAFTMAKQQKVSLIFTFAPEDTVSSDFVPKLLKLIEDKSDQILFVKLTCESEELKRRVVSSSRDEYAKGKSTKNINKHINNDHLLPVSVIERTFTIENTNMTPQATAEQIVKHYDLKKVEQGVDAFYENVFLKETT